MDIQFVSKLLYGGAIEAELPSSVKDLSLVTIVPDNQEVFTDMDTEATLIVDILERAECTDENTAVYHYEDLAGQNEAGSPGLSSIVSSQELPNDKIPNIPTSWKKYTLRGQMYVKPDRGEFTDRDLVQILMLIVRIPEVETDIVFHINLPLRQASTEDVSLRIEKYFKRFLETLKINDMGLFG